MLLADASTWMNARKQGGAVTDDADAAIAASTPIRTEGHYGIATAYVALSLLLGIGAVIGMQAAFVGKAI